jgi:hypothetical protein
MSAALQAIFDVFSRRPENAKKPQHVVPEDTRNRIVMWCADVTRNMMRSMEGENMFWVQIRRHLLFRHGKMSLMGGDPNSFKDTLTFLMSCDGEHFLDFVEYIFRIECAVELQIDNDTCVDQINGLLQIDNVSYYLTGFVREETTGRLYGHERVMIKTVQVPRIILRESEVMHSQAIVPTLEFLKTPEFASANTEFLNGLQDYRKGDYGDCMTKCGSAFESVMKVICAKKRWPHKETDVANTLVKTMIDNTNLDSYFEQLLIIVATLRNRLSSSHGGGAKPRNPPQHLARYVVNATASAILLLADEVGMS